ncbi:MAG: hypothetical protein JW703_00355 [Candidatus Diapherotrites archaeon]|nr:hypothetical protein [Candidatus Diapherotrites archaeon]
MGKPFHREIIRKFKDSFSFFVKHPTGKGIETTSKPIKAKIINRARSKPIPTSQRGRYAKQTK